MAEKAGPGPAPALVMLRQQLKARWRPWGVWQYGIMGDEDHQRRPSAHNRGDALDIPTVLPGLVAQNELLEHLRSSGRSNSEPRLRLVIWARRSASAASRWLWVPYRGSSPHEMWAHVEIHHHRRNDARPWSLPS